MMEKSDHFSIQDAMRMAQSPAGQQLLAMLRQKNSDELQQAMIQASAGNYTGAQQLLSDLMKDPQALALLSKLGGK